MQEFTLGEAFIIPYIFKLSVILRSRKSLFMYGTKQ